MKEFDLAEIEKYNGKNGNPVYIVHQGNVYDVTESRLWKTGTHMKRHPSGKDLTADILAAPHDVNVLERYPKVGTVKKAEVAEIEMPAVLAGLLRRYPMLRRHPHPMTVHFPIVFMFSTTLFNILFLISGYRPFELTAFHCLGAGILFTIVTILTGLYTWWLNYLSKPSKATTIKKRTSIIMLIVATVAFIWRGINPDVMAPLQGTGFIYLLLILALLPLVTVIGWFGAELTFPVNKE